MMQRAASSPALVWLGLLRGGEAAACQEGRTCSATGDEPVEDLGLLQARRGRAGAAQVDYETRAGANCFHGNGAVDIDSDHSAPSHLSESQCKARCSDDGACDCVTFRPSDGKCWKRKQCQLDRCWRGTEYTTYFKGGAPTPAPPAPASDRYWPHFDTTPDYLNITARIAGAGSNPGSKSDNYYLVISDNGGCGGCGTCCTTQKRVAAKMREFVANRKRQNPHSQLLFVLVGGDNFYWNGASPGRFHRTWLDVYGPELTSVPWFAVLGNHDYGNDDHTAVCPNVSPRFVCNDTNLNTPACGGAKPYSTHPQAYDSNALNADKGGSDGEARKNWHQPDYTYYYTIPELDLEIVAIDWNVYQFNAMGGNGWCSHCGAGGAARHCRGTNNARREMQKVTDASTELFNSRAQAAEHKNIAIISHYPSWFQNNINLRRKYEDTMPEDKREGTKIFNFYGHTHSQRCEGKSSSGECLDFLTGAAGGCCGFGDAPAGFTALSWSDETNEQVVECFLGPECTLARFSVLPPGRQSGIPEDNTEDVCMHTEDDPRCANWTR